MTTEIDNAMTYTDIVIVSYWPGQSSDEVAIGYGISKLELMIRIAIAIYSFTSAFYSLFIEPRFKPLERPGTRLLISMLPAGGMAILSLRERKKQGYYQLDAQGRPVQFLSALPPDPIKGRAGISSKKFLTV